MKLIHKLTLGFLSVALLLAIVGGIQFAFITEIHEDVHQIAGSSIGEVETSIGTAYRVALIGADISETLLTLQSQGETLDPARKQQILDDLTDLEKTFTNLKNGTTSELDLAEDEDDEAGEESELEEIAELEELLLG